MDATRVSATHEGMAGGINGSCHGFTGGVQNQGGQVMNAPVIVPIYWGSEYANADKKGNLDQFFRRLAESDYTARLSQYNVGPKFEVKASTVISASITQIPDQTPLVAQLQSWITNKQVPIPAAQDNNWIYVIQAPTGVAFSTAGLGGYHSNASFTVPGIAGSVNLLFAIIGGWNDQGLGVASRLLSHELLEAFTNPRGGGWVGNQGACEIGDIAEQDGDAYMGPWEMEKYWSNTDKANAAGFGSIASMGFAANRDPRVYLMTPDSHVRELAWLGTRWQTRDLTAETGLPTGPFGTSIACMGFGPSSDPRVYVALAGGTGFHIHELAWVGQWARRDVTSDAGAPAAVRGTALTCMGFGNSHDPRVYYLTSDNHIHELAWVGKWATRDLTSDAGAPVAGNGSPLTCMGVGNSHDPRVYYLTSDNHIHELAWVGRWVSRDVTQDSGGAPVADREGALTCLGFGANRDPRVYYLDTANAATKTSHVHELAWLGNKWANRDLTADAHAPAAASGSSLTCMGIGANQDSRVYFQVREAAGDQTEHVHELAWIPGWASRDVTKDAGAAAAVRSSLMGAMGFGGGSDPRVYYWTWDEKTANGHVHELAWVGHWGTRDVTQDATAMAMHG